MRSQLVCWNMFIEHFRQTWTLFPSQCCEHDVWLSLGHCPPFFYVTINMIYITYDKARKTHYRTKDRAKGPVKTLQTFLSLTAARLCFNQRMKQPPAFQTNCKRTTCISWQLGSSSGVWGVKGRLSVSWRGKSWPTLCKRVALIVESQQGSMVKLYESQLRDITAKTWF